MSSLLGPRFWTESEHLFWSSSVCVTDPNRDGLTGSLSVVTTRSRSSPLLETTWTIVCTWTFPKSAEKQLTNLQPDPIWLRTSKDGFIKLWSGKHGLGAAGQAVCASHKLCLLGGFCVRPGDVGFLCRKTEPRQGLTYCCTFLGLGSASRGLGVPLPLVEMYNFRTCEH